MNVLWLYGVYQDLYAEPISSDVNVTYIQGLADQDTIESISPHLIVIDDMMSNINNNQALEDMFTKYSHHNRRSIILIVQNIFHKSSTMRTISLNCHNMILLKNPRDSSQIYHLSRQLFPSNPKHLVEVFKDATQSSHGYIRLDLPQGTPEKYRLQTRLTREEVEHLNVSFAPIIYMPR